jgi:lipopolysaccharide export LptBFGC system permease protein LptF
VVVPPANQRFRELLIANLIKVGVARDAIHLERGPNERSLRELYVQMQRSRDESPAEYATVYSFHSRLAVVLSPLAFALLAFGVVSMGRERWLAVAAAISLVLGVVVTVWYDGPADAWPPLLRAYTPDLVFGTWGAVLLWCAVKWPDVEQPITDART